jgi:hypothetical protein
MSLVAAVCGDTTTRVENSGDREHGVTVSGEGKVTGAPDIATISLGVSALAPTVAEARMQAATALEGMIASMEANGIAEKDIQTQDLSIYPEYDYNPVDQRQTLRGFRVSNTVVAKVRDIDTTGAVVDDAVDAGGDTTQIQGIAFSIDDPEELRRQAREQAVQDARARAETLAQAGGVSLGEPVTITETSYRAPVYYDEVATGGSAADRQAAPETPIEAGELDVVVTVDVTWGIQ